jgi:hypothetical protein
MALDTLTAAQLRAMLRDVRDDATRANDVLENNTQPLNLGGKVIGHIVDVDAFDRLTESVARIFARALTATDTDAALPVSTPAAPVSPHP